MKDKKGSCFWRHKWTKWEQYTQPIMTKFGEGIKNRQKRYCLKCNKMEDELI